MSKEELKKLNGIISARVSSWEEMDRSAKSDEYGLSR